MRGPGPHFPSRAIQMHYDIMLVFCPIFDVKEPPLGLAYIAENLSASGWRVCVKDLNLEFYLSNTDKQNLWKIPTSYDVSLAQNFENDIIAASQEIAGSGVPLVGFSVNQTNLYISVEIARIIKKLNREVMIIFGGPECFLKPDRDHIPSDAIDYFVVGDGEIIVNNFLSSFVKGNCFEAIDGIIPSGKNRELKYSPKIYPSQKDLKTPTFKGFSVEKYTSTSLPVIFTRGCVRQCVFCNDKSYFRPFSVADPVRFADALQFYFEEYGIDNFSFHDQAVNGSSKEFLCFLQEIIRRRMKINWSSNMIVRNGMDRNFFRILRSAGCRNLIFGIESFSDRILLQMKKDFKADEAIEVLKLCSEAGISVSINIIVGFPGETEEDIDKTINFLRQNRRIINKVLNLSTCFVAPNSDLECRPKDFGIMLPKNHFSNWHTIDGHNTNDSRIALVERLKVILEKIGIPLETVNILRDDDAYLKLDDRLRQTNFNSK